MCTDSKKTLITVLVIITVTVVLIAAVYTGYQGTAASRRVIYPAGTELYGLGTQVVSAYNLIVNINSNSTVKGAWSSAWHILPDAGPNALLINNSKVVPLVNHTGPAQVSLLGSHFPPPSYYPTNGAFSITITFVTGGNFRLSGYCAISGPSVYRFNPDALYPHAELKYGLLFSFVFIYAPSWINVTNYATPYFDVTQEFMVVSS